MKAGIFKFIELKRGINKGNCPLCLGNEYAKDIIPSFP
jgi:hypothetical protein